MIKKADKIVLNSNTKNREISEIDSKPNQLPVSKSYGANIDYGENLKEFPFKDSLKLIKNNKPVLLVSKSEDLSRVT